MVTTNRGHATDGSGYQAALRGSSV